MLRFFFFQNSQVSSNVPYDKLGGNSNVTGSQQRFGSCMLWSLQLHFIFGISQAMSLRHAAAYAVFDKEEDIVKAARNLSLLVHQSFRTASSYSQPCTQHKVRGQDEIWWVCHQMRSDTIRCYQIHIRYYHLTMHICYIRKTSIPRLPRRFSIVFFFKARWCSHTEILKPLVVESSSEELPFVSSTKGKHLVRSGNFPGGHERYPLRYHLISPWFLVGRVYQIIFWKIVQNCINMRWC